MSIAWWHRFSARTAGPSSAASSTNTSEPHRGPGQHRWPSSGTPQADQFRSSPSCSRRAASWPLFVPAAGPAAGSTPHHPIQAAIEALAKCPSLPLGWKTGAAALQERRRRAARVPNVPGQGLDPAEPVMYLPWTGVRPVMYPPYTCAGDTPGSPGREVRLCRCERGARLTGAKSGVKNRGRFHLQRPR